MKVLATIFKIICYLLTLIIIAYFSLPILGLVCDSKMLNNTQFNLYVLCWIILVSFQTTINLSWFYEEIKKSTKK